MNRTQQILWAVVIVIIIGALYWWLSSSQTPANPTSTLTAQLPVAPSTGGASGEAAPMTATITFDGTQFSPSNVTIAQGGTVMWISSGGPMWIASDPHPLHNGYDGTTLQQHCAQDYAGPAPFDQCADGTDWSFTFNKVGTWGYHDHLDESAGGEVTVVASQ